VLVEELGGPKARGLVGSTARHIHERRRVLLHIGIGILLSQESKHTGLALRQASSRRLAPFWLRIVGHAAGEGPAHHTAGHRVDNRVVISRVLGVSPRARVGHGEGVARESGGGGGWRCGGSSVGAGDTGDFGWVAVCYMVTCQYDVE
jgi:hypothetical protein